MLLYALLHLTGYDLPIEELKRFRQLHSKTPGPSGVRLTPGVETTTGPLGQGLANAVGMALAERLLAAEFNRPGHDIVDHRTYVFLGDGCLMEGISHEACSLAGTWGLGKLIAFYDDNGISIDGETRGWFTDDTPRRFEAYGWHVIPHVDGHDVEAVDAAISAAQAVTDRPTLICCKTVIGKGAPTKAGTRRGARRGAGREGSRRDARGARLEVPAVRDSARDLCARGTRATRAQRASRHGPNASRAIAPPTPTLAAEFTRRMHGELPATWAETVRGVHRRAGAPRAKPSPRARLRSRRSRRSRPRCPNSSAARPISPDRCSPTGRAARRSRGPSAGNYVNFGVREFGMSAIANGMALPAASFRTSARS